MRFRFGIFEILSLSIEIYKSAIFFLVIYNFPNTVCLAMMFWKLKSVNQQKLKKYDEYFQEDFIARTILYVNRKKVIVKH